MNFFKGKLIYKLLVFILANLVKDSVVLGRSTQEAQATGSIYNFTWNEPDTCLNIATTNFPPQQWLLGTLSSS